MPVFFNAKTVYSSFSHFLRGKKFRKKPDWKTWNELEKRQESWHITHHLLIRVLVELTENLLRFNKLQHVFSIRKGKFLELMHLSLSFRFHTPQVK